MTLDPFWISAQVDISPDIYFAIFEGVKYSEREYAAEQSK